MKPVNVRLPENLIDKMDRVAKQVSLSRSEIVRQALTLYVALMKNLGRFLRVPIQALEQPGVSVVKRGDLLLLRMLNGQVFVVGCSSSGGIGSKPNDKVKVDGYTLGRFMSRVALIDVLASGAKPLAVTVTLSVERSEYGRSILKGVKDEALKVGVDPDSAVKENFEDNVVTDETGLGVVAIGIASEEELKIGTSKRGDVVIAIGEPKVGIEVLQAEREKRIVDPRDVVILSKARFIHDIAPVGSYGIAQEAKHLAYSAGLKLKLKRRTGVELSKSAGPATVVLVTLNEESIRMLREMVDKPLTMVGSLF